MKIKTIAAGIMIAGAALSIGSAAVAEAGPQGWSHGPVHHGPCTPPPPPPCHPKPPVPKPVARKVSRHIVGKVTTPPATHAPNGANGAPGASY